MSADKFMASLLSENSNEPFVQEVSNDRCLEKESAGGILSFEGLVTVGIPKSPISVTEQITNGVAEIEVMQKSTNNSSNIDDLKSPKENVTSDVFIEETKSLIDDNVDSIEAQNGIGKKSNKVDGTEVNDINTISKKRTDKSVNKAQLRNCNGDLSPESKVHLEAARLPATQNYREESESSDDDTSSTFSLGSSSDCSDSFLDKMHKNSTPNKIVNIKTKGELDLDDLPPIEDLTITVKESEMQKVGTIYAIVDKLVIVRSLKNLQPLDLDSVLFLSYKNPLGRIFDVFGPVVEPFYSIRFNNTQHIADKCIVNDADVFFAPDKTDITSYVFVDQLRNQKGSDASWQDNNEPPEEHLDYSDDEEEKRAKWKRRAKNRSHSFEDDDVQIIPHKATHNSKGAQGPWKLKDSTNYKSSPSQQYISKPVPDNPFFTPYSQHASSQSSSILNFSRPTMAAVMTSKYTPTSSKNDTSKITSNASQHFAQQKNFVTHQAAYPPSQTSFQFRPSTIVLPQTSVAQSPFIFQARPVPFVPNQMPPQSPLQPFPPRSPQQPYMVQPPSSPAPAFQQHPVFGQVPSFNQALMSPAPVQNHYINQQQVLSYAYPSYRPLNFVSQAPNFVNQAPNFVNQAPNFGNQAPNFSNQAPNFGNQAPIFVRQAPNFVSQAPNFVSQASTYTSPAVSSSNQVPKLMYHTNFMNQAPNFVNSGAPMLVETAMGPQLQQLQSMTPPPTMRVAPLTVNIPTSPSPNAVHPFLQQSPGLLNVMPPQSRNFTHNRY